LIPEKLRHSSRDAEIYRNPTRFNQSPLINTPDAFIIDISSSQDCMVDSTLTMSTSPLVDLVQAIHLPSHRFLLTTSANPDSSSIIDLHLFAPTPVSDGDTRNGEESGTGSSSSSTSGKAGPRSIITWQGQIDLDDTDVSPCSALSKRWL